MNHSCFSAQCGLALELGMSPSRSVLRPRGPVACCGAVQVRVAAVHAHVEELMERLAALECDVGGLLDRHEELTRDRPWYQQHVRFHYFQWIKIIIQAATDKHMYPVPFHWMKARLSNPSLQNHGRSVVSSHHLSTGQDLCRCQLSLLYGVKAGASQCLGISVPVGESKRCIQ